MRPIRSPAMIAMKAAIAPVALPRVIAITLGSRFTATTSYIRESDITLSHARSN